MLIAQPRRPARAGEWTSGTAIVFVVTLAATGSVTLAARDAGMSRKSAYALKKRDPLFAASWEAAKRAAESQAKARPADNKRGHAAPSISSSAKEGHVPPAANLADPPAWRNRLLVELRIARESARSNAPTALAGHAPVP